MPPVVINRYRMTADQFTKLDIPSPRSADWVKLRARGNSWFGYRISLKTLNTESGRRYAAAFDEACKAAMED